MRRIAWVLLALPLSACEADPLRGIEAEIATMEQKGVAVVEVERARVEADLAEAAVAEAKTRLVETEGTLAAQTARRAALASEEERARTAAPLAPPGPGLEAFQRRTEAAKRKARRLAREIANARGDARRVRERAALLESQLRPGDEAWASARRLVVLAELVEEARARHASDPVIRRLAEQGTDAGAVDPSAATVEAGRERAARLARRMTEVFRLDDPALSPLDVPPPAP